MQLRMNNQAMRMFATGSMCLALLALGGCGGGSTDGGTTTSGDDGGDDGGVTGLSNATLTGQYSFMGLDASVSPVVRRAGFGTYAFNGAGAFTTFAGVNDNQAVTPPAPGAGNVYSIQDNGALTVSATTAGGVTSDGRVALISNVASGIVPGMRVFIRRSGTYSNATLSGSYHFASLIASTANGTSALWTDAATGPCVSDGAGTLTCPAVKRNADGTQVTNLFGATSYGVSTAGEFTHSSLAGNVQGGITSGGSFAVGTGGTQANADPLFNAYIKQGTGMSNAAFKGAYWVVGIYSDPSDGGQWLSFNGTVTADGAGDMNYVSTTENFEGAIDPNSGPDNYSVSSTGVISNGDRVGAITQDGEFAFLTGATSTGGTPMLFIFARKQ